MHSCGSSTWWPTWKTCLAWKSEEVHATVKSVTGNYNKQSQSSSQWWFSSMTTPDSTLYSRLRIHCKIQFGNAGPSPIHLWFGSQLIEQAFELLFLNLQWRHHTSYHHMADTTGTNTVSVQDGLTNHMLWQVPQPWKRLCRKIMCQSHLHYIVIVSSLI